MHPASQSAMGTVLISGRRCLQIAYSLTPPDRSILIFISLRELPDMMSASKGGGGRGKADVVREVTLILWHKSVPNVDEGWEGVKKAENFVDVIIWKLPNRREGGGEEGRH